MPPNITVLSFSVISMEKKREIVKHVDFVFDDKFEFPFHSHIHLGRIGSSNGGY